MKNGLVYLIVSFLPLSALAQTPAKTKGLNPDISVNTLLLYQNGNRGNHNFSEPRNGLDIQEAELVFTADVDPYSRFMGTFSLHQEVEVDDSTEPPTRSAEYVFEPEEVFAETIAVPAITF